MSETPCPRCGQLNTPDSNFCSVCGAELPGDTASESTATHPVITAFDGDGAPMMVITRGSNAGSKFAIVSDVTSIGRHPESSIFLDDVTVSRRHAEIRRRAGSYHLADVGSLNGTYVGGERVEEVALYEGDQVQVGKFKMVFVMGTSVDQ